MRCECVFFFRRGEYRERIVRGEGVGVYVFGVNGGLEV